MIFLTSGLILFLELALIRYLPAEILYFGFFTNFVLLACFFGIGVGFILSRVKHDFLKYFPVLLLMTLLLTKLFQSGLNIVNNEVIFFRSDKDVQEVILPIYLVLPILYITVAALFSSLAHYLSKFFASSEKPLQAYIYDILGSVFGILFFYLISFLGLPPIVWFGACSAIFLLIARKSKILLIFYVVILLVTLIFGINQEKGQVFWSPYQKISLFYNEDTQFGNIMTNNIHHQYFSHLKDAPEYALIYSLIRSITPLNQVLIIGSGSGQDVNAALKTGARSIDAVEIDPKILEIGRQYHPEAPYDDPKVHVTNNDGRNILHTTDKKYDVIVFALTDSLILLNSYSSQIRLESYLFTTDAFREAKSHLKPGGIFVMYNDYRTDWLISRLRTMLTVTFGTVPKEFSFGSTSKVFVDSPDWINRKKTLSEAKIAHLPSDNWPFIYLKEPGIPAIYLNVFLIISVLSVTTISLLLFLTRSLRRLNLSRSTTFFFLGAAFSLIETKSIVQLNLLFGSSWLVNGISFTSILLTVLFASLLTVRYKKINIYPVMLCLFLSLLVQTIIPVKLLLVPNIYIKLLVVCLFFYLPIFFANLLFAKLFQHSRTAELDFGSNILGFLLGGMTEYVGLIFGYSALTFGALLFYLVASLFTFARRNQKE